jgi:hypothetical protein
MRNGFKIFDTDTHVGPSMDILDDLKRKLFWDNPVRFFNRYRAISAA